MLMLEDMNFLDTLRIAFVSVEETFDEVVRMSGAAEDGEQRNVIVVFETAEESRKLSCIAHSDHYTR
jgi:hypothetical protein